jgi:hypothetical protein
MVNAMQKRWTILQADQEKVNSLTTIAQNSSGYLQNTCTTKD